MQGADQPGLPLTRSIRSFASNAHQCRLLLLPATLCEPTVLLLCITYAESQSACFLHHLHCPLVATCLYAQHHSGCCRHDVLKHVRLPLLRGWQKEGCSCAMQVRSQQLPQVHHAAVFQANVSKDDWQPQDLCHSAAHARDHATPLLRVAVGSALLACRRHFDQPAGRLRQWASISAVSWSCCGDAGHSDCA